MDSKRATTKRIYLPRSPRWYCALVSLLFLASCFTKWSVIRSDGSKKPFEAATRYSQTDSVDSSVASRAIFRVGDREFLVAAG